MPTTAEADESSKDNDHEESKKKQYQIRMILLHLFLNVVNLNIPVQTGPMVAAQVFFCLRSGTH